MSSRTKTSYESTGEILVAWKKYKAATDDELTLHEGDLVELLDTSDPLSSSSKRLKLDPELDSVTGELLDSAAAKHKLSVRPKRTYPSSRHSPSRINVQARWLVREVQGSHRQGWVPCQILQSVDEPIPGSGIPGDAAFRRQAVVKELVETEQEFVRDLDYVIQKYLFNPETSKAPKTIKDNLETVFGNLGQIAEFHSSVLMEGVRYYANEPHLLGKAFLRLERDFDKHVSYCSNEPQAQAILETCDQTREFFEELSQRLGDDKTISEHLKLPIQRINDYQLLLKELVRYSACLGEDNSDLQKALELMLSIPHRAQDDKFTNSIEGYRGSIHKLGRLLAHDWFSITFDNTTKERYLFLFKARILICKVRRISEDRSVFQLKDIVRLPQVEIRDHPEEGCTFELIEKNTGNCLVLTAHRDRVKDFWLKEIREFASDATEAEESGSDELQVLSAPSERISTAQVIEEVSSKEQPINIEKPRVTEEQKAPISEAKKEPVKVKEKSPEVIIKEPEEELIKPEEPKQTLAKSDKKVKVEVEQSKPVQAQQRTAKTTEEQLATDSRASNKQVEILTKQPVSIQQVSTVEQSSRLTEVVQNGGSVGEPTATTVLTGVKQVENFYVGVEVNVDVEDMSRKYSGLSSSREGYSTESSYSRRSGLSSYSGDGVTSSRYGAESSLTGKYDSDLGSKYSITGKYSSEKSASKYDTDSYGSKYDTEKSITSKYSADSALTGSKYEELSSKYGVDSALTPTSKYEELASKYGRSVSSNTEGNGSKYGDSALSYSRKSIADTGEGEYSYSRKITKSSALGDDSGDSYSYSRRTERKIGDGDDDDYSFSRRSIKGRRITSDADGGEESYSYSRRSARSAALEEKSGDGDSYSYSRRSVRSSIEGKGGSDAGDNEYKYSRKSITSAVGDDDSLGSKSYVKRSSITSEEGEQSVLGKYSRRSAASYGDDDTDITSKYRRKYSRSDSANEKKDSKNGETVSITKVSETKALNGKESVTATSVESSDSISTTFKTSRERIPTGQKPLDDKPNFTKNLRGTNIEPGDSAIFEVALAEPPDSLVWLKDNKPLNGDGSLTGRILSTASENKREHRLQIRQVDHADAGLYTAVASNSKGKTTCSAQLIVHELNAEERAARTEHDKPEFIIQLKDTELLEDTYLRFMVKVKGEPNPDIAFFKDGVKISENSDYFQIIREHSDKGFYELVIPNVKPADAGVYKCVASNKFGEASSEATVTVTDTKNLFDDLPENELLPPGEKPAFQWKKDGKPFEPEERFRVLLGDDEDSLALIFQHVRPEDVGLYTCVAQTSRGHISCSAELTVHGTVNQLFREPEKPKLVIEKREAIVNAGSSAMLELQVKGFPKPNVKWTHEGKPIEPSGKYKFLYEDEESMSLVIKNVENADAGKYTVSAQNELGEDTAEMTLSVKAPPKIKSKPEPVTVAVEETIRIPIIVEGNPQPTVQFYKDGKELKSSERVKIIEEGEKHTLVIEKSTLKDTGSYSVIATNEQAQVSQFWDTYVYSAPKILKKLGDKLDVSQGEVVELKLQVQAEPPAEVKWFKDDQELTMNDHYLINKDGDMYILKISGAVTTDAAKYKVRAINIHGSVDDEIQVFVKKPPKITRPLEDMTVTEHDKNVTFDVGVEAYPKPTVKWFLDEMELSETRSEFTRIESDDGFKLVIKEVSSELSGQYTCKVVNELGATETSAKLTVNCKPRIIKHLQDTVVDEGATLHLEVEVDACPEPSVKWLRNGKEVSTDARIKISRDKKRHETYNLDVNLIKYEEGGEYEVVVTNALGTISSKSHVTVQKVIHTDAIEETEEPPKKLKVELVEEPEPPQMPETKEIVEEPKEPEEGIAFEKEEIEEVKPDIKSPEPLIEEPASPKIPEQAKKATRENAEIVEIDEGSSKSEPIVEEELPKRKPSRGKSVQFDIIEEEQRSEPATPIEEEIPKKEPQRGRSASREEAEIIVIKEPETPQVPAEKNIPKAERKSSVHATVEEAETVESKNEPKTPVEEDVPKKKAQKAVAAQKAEADVVEYEAEQGTEKVAKKTVERQESQKGVRHIDEEEDEEMEALLRRAQKQRSLIEDISKESESPQAAPTISDSNMKDTSRPESLDISYIVKGTANPPPVATWTLDGKEVKPDGRVKVSQKGEEFRLEILKLDLKDAGVWECKLSNPLGDVKQRAVLEVTPEKELRRPKLKEGLQDQTVVKKNTVTLKAVVIGDPVPDVTWYKDGKPISAEEFEKFKIILESEDREIEDGLKECTFSLTIPRCDSANAGNYRVKAKNKWGECESSAELTVVLRPEIEGLEDVSAVPGEAVQFTCIIRANPLPEVTWTKDNKKLETCEAMEVIHDVPNETYKLVIHCVELSDEGYYRVTAKNKLGEDYKEARLKTIKEQEPSTEKPKFITGLTDDQVEHKGEITVMVRADGLPKPEIRWYLDGKAIVEDEHHKIITQGEAQVTSSLAISNYNEKDSGIYKAVAVNCAGEAETSARISMHQTPPTFGKRLEKSEEVNEGEPLELKAKINGSPRPQVAWYKDGDLIPEGDERVQTSILPDGTVKLNIEKVVPTDSGAYKLVISNPMGEIAGLCAVAVNPKPQRPKFLKCIKDTKAPQGDSVRLEAKVAGFPAPEIKWLKDGVPVRLSSNVHLETHPDGSVALIIDRLKPENVGIYQLVASNKLGEISNDAKVEIEKKPIKPEFVLKMEPLKVVEGFPARFEVKAIGYPEPEIAWTRNGVEVVGDKKHIKVLTLEDGTSVLLLDSCNQSRDALTYKAVAKNVAGEAETSADLTVTPSTLIEQPEKKPAFLHPLRDVTADEGQSLVIEAPFEGNPVPSVQWFKDGEPLVPSDRIWITCDGKKVRLHIDNAKPADAGVYKAVITSPLGSDSSEAKATIHKVFAPPIFTQKFTDLQQLPEKDAKFPARVTGVPTPEVTWYKDGEPITESSKYYIKRDGDVCCLTVANCQPSDAGLYRAIATNREGQDTCTATLEVVKEIKTQQKIEAPVFLKRIGDLELYKAMTAKFTACASGIPEPTVEWFKDDQKLYPSDRIRMETDKAGLLRLSISNVTEDDLGKYTCKISNEHGSDICHAALSFAAGVEPKTKRPVADQFTEFDKYKRSGVPMPLADPPIISQMADRHLTLSWKPSIPSAPRAPVTYQLEMLELPHGDWFTVRSGIRSCTCGVRNLEPFRDYKFRIRVENKYGLSDPSPFAVTHREKLEPELPKFRPYLPPEIDFRPETSPYFPKDFDIERPPHDKMAQAPRFLRREHDTTYGVKDQNTNLFWFVYGYPKPKMTYYFNDEPIESGGRFDMSYTRNGQATLFINKMLDRDVGWYEAVATNEHGEARQRVRLEIAELPYFIRRPDIGYAQLRGKVRFEARIVGVPYPEIKWYKDWKPLAPSSRIKIIFTEPDTTTLIISDVISKDEGLYSVSARNVAGTASSSAMLYVEEDDWQYKLLTYNTLSPIKTKKKLYTDFYDIGDELGRGTQGVTYHAVERANGNNYAAKIMHGRGELRPFMYNEYDMLNQLRHRKLISLHDAYENEDTLGLILELGAGGELVKDHLLKQDSYTERDIAGYIRQILQGLEYMHGRGYGHMGLTLGDLFLSHAGGDDLKIGDFGLTRRVDLGRLYPLNYGVPEYVSPEAAFGEGTGLPHDMWSVGIITYILLSGRSPFRGRDDRETLLKIQEGKWSFDESWWKNISAEAKDFISKLLVFQADGRLDVHAALRHPWLERADRQYSDEFRIHSRYLTDYYKLFREWYDNASCKKWLRRRPLEGAFTHPSRMVYPPGDYSSPTPVERTPAPEKKTRPPTWEDQLPTRSPLNYEIGLIKSESHYQNGPDTYLLQLRDVNFPVRLREYMKVAGSRGPGGGHILSDENGYDWQSPVIRERRRFTDIMDEEIDDERKARINRYGADGNFQIRRLRHEIGSRLDTYVEAEAFIESIQDGRLPFFREKPKFTAMIEGQDLKLSCFAVGEPQPIIQWFKNDAIIAESHRIKIINDDEGRSHLKLSPALAFDQGMYKVVARNKIGQTVARTRIVLGQVPDEPDSPEVSQVSDTEILLTWKQPKFDGHSPVTCYRLEYKLAEDLEWAKKADNIDHEFYLVSGLEPNTKYKFRLAAKNAIGWSEQSVATAAITTEQPGAPKVKLSKATQHLQQITDSGEEVEEETHTRLDYSNESQPVEWQNSNVEDTYNFISELSRGRYSTVLKAVNKVNDRVVVIKALELENHADDVEGEFAALRSLRHERIAALFEAYKTSDAAYFVLEKLQGADILTYLASKHEYSEQIVATVVGQILDGLQYLHWRGLCHLDIQPDNVVMANVRSVQVKLVDLGSAHRVTKLGTKIPVVGHPDYISPEVLSEEPAFPQTDIWSVGVLTYLLLSGTVPFRGEDENESRQNILFVRYRFEHLYKELSQEATRFLMLLFKRHPNKRPSAEECQENRWLLPTDYMIKKRERAVFLGNRLKEYAEEYHSKRAQEAKCTIGTKGLTRSQSVQEELLTITP